MSSADFVRHGLVVAPVTILVTLLALALTF